MSADPQPIKRPAEQFSEYVEGGMVIVPIPPDENGNPQKGPEGEESTGWSLLKNCITDVSQIESGMTQAGLAHLYSGTACLDLDDIEEARKHFAEHSIDIDKYRNAKDAVHIDSGKPNRDKLLFKVSKKLAKKLRWQNKQKLGFELRCSTSKGTTVQDVLPPSIHPDTGGSYKWKGDWRNLPPLPKKLKKYWLELVEPKAPPLVNREKPTVPKILIESALTAIDPDCDYQSWIQVGMALHSAGHGDLWTEWSSEGNKYRTGECERNLQRFDASRGITISTLFYHARESGWVCKIQSPYTLNDLGNAQRLALSVADQVRHIADLNLDMVWSERGWIEDRDNTLHKAFKDVVDAMLQESTHLDSKQGKPLYSHAKASGNAAKIRAACELARMEAPIATLSDEWDAGGDLITFSDGTVLNIRTMESRPMHQGDLIRRRINAPFDLSAECPEFDFLIDHLVSGDKDARNWLLQLLSTGLAGDVLVSVILVLWGASKSGKTTFVEVVKRVMGELAVSPAPEFILKPKYPNNANAPNAEVFNLQGRRAAFIAEFPPGRLDENKLKTLTGGDTLSVRQLHSNNFVEVRCRLTITISSNSKPFFDATDQGMLRRVRAIHVNSPLDFSRHKPQRLNAIEWILDRESAGIAALLVRSLHIFIKAGESLPDSSRVHTDTESLNLANDRVGQFLNNKDFCVLDESRDWSKSAAYKSYVTHCEDNGHRPLSVRRFHEVMREHHGFREKKVDGDRRYIGIGEVDAL